MPSDGAYDLCIFTVIYLPNALPIRARSLRRQVRQLKGELARVKRAREVVSAPRRRPRRDVWDKAGCFVLPKIATETPRPSSRKDEPRDGERGTRDDDNEETERQSRKGEGPSTVTPDAAVDKLNDQNSILPEGHEFRGHRPCTGIGCANEKSLPHTFPAPPAFSTLRDAHEFVRAVREILWASTSTAAAARSDAQEGTVMDTGKYNSSGETNPEGGIRSTEQATGDRGTGAEQHGPSQTVAIIRNAVRAVLHAHSTDDDDDDDDDDHGVGTTGKERKGRVFDGLVASHKGAVQKRRRRQPSQLARPPDEDDDHIDDQGLNGHATNGVQRSSGSLAEPPGQRSMYHDHQDRASRLPPAGVRPTKVVLEQSDRSLFSGASSDDRRVEGAAEVVSWNDQSAVTNGVVARCLRPPKGRAREMSIGGDDDDRDLGRAFETFKRNKGREANLRLQVRSLTLWDDLRMTT